MLAGLPKWLTRSNCLSILCTPTLRHSCLLFRDLNPGCKKNASSWQAMLLTPAILHQDACSTRAAGTPRNAARWRSPNCENSSQTTLSPATSQKNLNSKVLLTSPQHKTLLSARMPDLEVSPKQLILSCAFHP